MPRRLIGFVMLVAGLSAVVGVVTSRHTPAWHEPSLGVTAIFVVLIAATDRLAVIFRHHGSGENLCAIEGLAAPLVFAGSGARAILVVVLGVALSQVLTRREPIKAVFNLAQWALATAAGVEVWHALGLPHTGSAASLGGLILALVAVVATNQALMSGVLWETTGHPLGATAAERSRLMYGRAISFGFNAVIGVLATALYVWQPWAIAVVAAPLLMLHLAGKGEAAMLGNQLRMLALQRAGHHLAASVDRASLQPFLDEVREGFEVEDIHLVLFGDAATPASVHGSAAGSRAGDGLIDLARGLTSVVERPMHIDATAGGTAAEQVRRFGRRRALVAPVRSGPEPIGMLLLFDRLGIDGFAAGELTIAGALARELAGYLARVELVGAIEDERRKLADIVDHTSDGIISIDAGGTIQSWNAGMAAMTGYIAEAMEGSDNLGLLRPRDAHGNDVDIAGWDDALAAAGLPPELQVTTISGAALWLSCSYSRVPVGEGGDILIVVARNVTKVRELELLKDDFVAVVSHELRTPLVPIKGWAQTLLQRGDRLSDEQRRTGVQSILSQAQRLESLVLNILEASRVEAGRAGTTERVDIAAVAVHVVEQLLAARPDRAIRMQPPAVPCYVTGSAVLVERAVTNLVGNAVKYSPDEEPVDVVVGSTHGLVTVSVTDRGPGIPAEAQDRIFHRFERLEETVQQTGTGLGLYITRRLARGMGGDVTVSSVPGAGSTFVLSLPVMALSPADLPTPRDAQFAESAGQPQAFA